MSCNCGCHNDKVPATGWPKYVPFIVGVAVLCVLVAGAVLKKDASSKNAAASTNVQSASAPGKGR